MLNRIDRDIKDSSAWRAPDDQTNSTLLEKEKIADWTLKLTPPSR
jgi:hypothetical protein